MAAPLAFIHPAGALLAAKWATVPALIALAALVTGMAYPSTITTLALLAMLPMAVMAPVGTNPVSS